MANVTMMILNDDLEEGQETFELSITNVTSDAVVLIGSSGNDTVTIIDNEYRKFIFCIRLNGRFELARMSFFDVFVLVLCSY